MVARSTFKPNALTYSDKEDVLGSGRGLARASSIIGEEYTHTPYSSGLDPYKYGGAQASVAKRSQARRYEEERKEREDERLKPGREREERAQGRKEAVRQRREDPIIDARYNELQRRTTADLIRPDVVEYWEKSAREGAQEHKDALLRKARSMGLNAAQMEALSQGIQKTDAAFEAKIEALRLESRRSAKEEFENFTLLLQEQGSAQIATEQALALEKEKARSAESRTLWGAILGGVGGALGGVAGYFATMGNPMGALAGFSAGSAAGTSVGGAI